MFRDKPVDELSTVSEPEAARLGLTGNHERMGSINHVRHHGCGLLPIVLTRLSTASSEVFAPALFV